MVGTRRIPSTRGRRHHNKAQPSTTLAHDGKGGADLNQAIQRTLIDLVSRAKPCSTICPSQVARALHAGNSKVYPDWRRLMEPVRNVVWRQVELGRLLVTQRGVVRPLEERHDIRGPIRVRRGPKWEEEEGISGVHGEDKEEVERDGEEGMNGAR